jgi:hypothetical protein
MAYVSHEEKFEILVEIYTLLGEQEQSLRDIAMYGEGPEHDLRAKRIDDLLGKVA